MSPLMLENLSFYLCSGVKLRDVDVVYTPWSNLKKSGAMEVRYAHVRRRF